MNELMTKLAFVLVLGTAPFVCRAADAQDTTMSRESARAMVEQSMQMWKIAEGVSIDDAIESMKLRANGLNFKLVADLPLSEQVKAMHADSGFLRCADRQAHGRVQQDIRRLPALSYCGD